MKISLVKPTILDLNPLAVFYYFCLTVLVVRGVIFAAINYNKIPAIYFDGMHLHHFVFGFLFLAMSLLGSWEFRVPAWLLEILFGISLGLIFDEFIFWTRGQFDYWSMGNFYAIAALSISAGLLSLADQTVYRITWRPRKQEIRTLKTIKYSFRRQVILPWVSFVSLLLIFFSSK
jgi:hypothetical protein